MAEEIRAAGKAVIVDEGGRILIMKRSDDETHHEKFWDVPGGRYDYGEHPIEGLERETDEEAGIEIEVVEPVKVWTFTRDDGQQIFGTTFLCKPVTNEVELGDEHTEYRWVRPEHLDDLKMHDELREGLKKCFETWQDD